MNLGWVAALSVLGLLVGPWLGIVVDRAVERVVPAAEHRCPRCERGLGLRSLIVGFGWFTGRCSCGARPSLRYPLVDLATAFGWGLVGYRFGDSHLLVPYLGLAAVSVVLAVIDIETHLLPNIIVWPSIWTSLFLVVVISGFNDDPDAIYSALVAGAVMGGFIGAAHLVYSAGMGRGDVKLAALLGLFVGWPHPSQLDAAQLGLYSLLLALIGGGVVGGLYNLARRRGRAEIPFGPALIGASWVVLAVG